MAGPGYARRAGSTPPPLPPVARTVGQVIAEALKLYGSRFVPALALGLPLAATTVLTHWLGTHDLATRASRDTVAFDRTLLEQSLVLVAIAPFLSLAYAWACGLEAASAPGARRLVSAVAIGTVVFVPAAFSLGWFALLGVAWLGVAGWVVPVVVNEGLPVPPALRRAFALFRADPAHAIGGLAALVAMFYVTRLVLEVLLREQADNEAVVASALADLVISPVIFLGAAIVYRDLVARVGTTKSDRARARAEALTPRPTRR
ncbi:MAG: hypothetical protein U0R50_00910 [Gaiellales bacterium]